MVKIDTIRNVKKNTDVKRHFAIVRSMKNPIAGVKQVDTLSPSKELFFWYLNCKKQGNWTNDMFEKFYVPRFVSELKNNPKACKLISEIVEHSKYENICLYCFCPDETECHRSIVAGILLGAGADIECDPKYIKYYDLWIN